jgi:nucleotidyltransferase substrate binding protein (TIGR01987 family)
MDYTQLKTAIERFGEMLEAYRDNAKRAPLEREAVQDSLIKRFEYTFEVAWKTCKRHLAEEGFAEAASGSPKSIIRLAAERKLIADAEAWVGYLAFRQDSPWQDYSKDNAESVLDIAENFYKGVVDLYQQMSGELISRVFYGR